MKPDGADGGPSTNCSIVYPNALQSFSTPSNQSTCAVPRPARGRYLGSGNNSDGVTGELAKNGVAQRFFTRGPESCCIDTMFGVIGPACTRR